MRMTAFDEGYITNIDKENILTGQYFDFEKAGLKEYDAYGFFKFNNGRFITDKFYVEAL